MLHSTFCHVPGIGKETERSLWQQGCLDWQTFLDNPSCFSVGSASLTIVEELLLQSRDALETGNHQFFRERLGLAESWRAWPHFRKSCVYLDIETDGSSKGSSVTVVGLFDGHKYRALTKGEDLENFRDIISHYSMIVTFFGTGFDLPVLQKRFKGLIFDQLHLDLCLVLKKLGYRGGLKKLEKHFGISRAEDLVGLTGREAVILWREYLQGSEKSLEVLLRYNQEDVVNLERLAEIAYEQLARITFPHHTQPPLCLVES